MKFTIMKRSLLSATLGSLLIGQVVAQERKVSVQLSQEPLTKLFSVIEKQTPYRFSYRDAVVNEQIISISKKNVPVRLILENVLRSLNLDYSMESENSIVIFEKQTTINSNSRTRTITGTVIDASGVPVIGANIMVKGSSTGTVTDVDGKFSIKASEGTILEVSYIGYLAQEIKVGKENTLSVTLREDFQKLDEVVVIGYGTQAKKDITGAVSVVSKDAIIDAPVLNFSEALQGKASGVYVNSSGAPGANTTIRVRGVGSVNGSDPLIVVDGISNVDIDAVNPNDIESMQILKDASATAIYGAREQMALSSSQQANNVQNKATLKTSITDT